MVSKIFYVYLLLILLTFILLFISYIHAIDFMVFFLSSY